MGWDKCLSYGIKPPLHHTFLVCVSPRGVCSSGPVSRPSTSSFHTCLGQKGRAKLLFVIFKHTERLSSLRLCVLFARRTRTAFHVTEQFLTNFFSALLRPTFTLRRYLFGIKNVFFDRQDPHLEPVTRSVSKLEVI